MSYLPVTTTEAPEGFEDSTAAEYIRDKWADFLALEARIVDLQHRAALASQAYRAAGNVTQAEAAKLLIRELGTLNQWHGKAVNLALPYLEALGLAGWFIPVAIAAGVSTAAVGIAWVWRKYGYLERALEALEAGVLTPGEFLELNAQAGSAPAEFLQAGFSGVKWVVLGLLALAFLPQITESFRRFKANPPLEIVHDNPPGRMSGRVYSILYRHDDDGEDYRHDFRPGVELETLPDGRLLLSHPSRTLWRDFD